MQCVCELDWQAIATAVTGVLAVGAAAYVGRKQTKLIENEPKIQLLEKRSACVNSMRKIYNAWDREMRLPDEERREFYNLSLQAMLLYPKNMTKLLDEAVSATFWAEQYRKRSHQYYEDGKLEKAAERQQAAYAEEDKAMKIMPNLLDTLTKYTRVDFQR